MFGRPRPKIASAARDAWYRSADWDDRARAEFETRLARARPWNRIQFRSIKALALLDSRDRRKQAAGREMLQWVISEGGGSHAETVTAICLLGAHEQDVGMLVDAERHLRQALDRMSRDPSGGTQTEEVRLAEILLGRGGRATLEEARDLLEHRAKDPPLLLAAQFRMCVAGARVSLALDDDESAAEWAAAALRLSAATHSGLRNHPVLGLVETGTRTRRWLAEVAARGG